MVSVVTVLYTHVCPLLPTAFFERHFFSLQPLDYPVNITGQTDRRWSNRRNRQTVLQVYTRCYSNTGVTVQTVTGISHGVVVMAACSLRVSRSAGGFQTHSSFKRCCYQHTRTHTQTPQLWEINREEIKWKIIPKKRTRARIGLLPRRHLRCGRILEVRVQTTEVTTVQGSSWGQRWARSMIGCFHPLSRPPKGPDWSELSSQLNQTTNCHHQACV